MRTCASLSWNLSLWSLSESAVMWCRLAVRFLSPYDLDLFLLLFIYSSRIHHLLFMEFIFLGRIDCFVVFLLKFMAIFSDYLLNVTAILLQCGQPGGFVSFVLFRSVMQMLTTTTKRQWKQCPRRNGRTRLVDFSQHLF